MDSLDDHWMQDPIFDDLEAAQESMHIPELAAAWLRVLGEDGGLPDVSTIAITHKGKPLNRPVLEDPANMPSDPNTYPARLGNGQVVWVKQDERHYGRGAVRVVEKPRRNRAILAALTIMEARTADIDELGNLLPLIDLSHPDGVSKSVDEAADEGFDTWMRLAGAFDSGWFKYALALLRYFRPNFDGLAEEEKRDLLLKCCERINKFLEASRHLSEFLEYGAPNRDQRPAVENPGRDVTAAVLRDVEQATHRRIANELLVDVSEKARCVGDYSAMGRMVSRGRNILEQAFGKDEWAEKAEELRSEFIKRDALSFSENLMIDSAREWGVGEHAARLILRGELHTVPEVARIPQRSLQARRDLYRALIQEEGGAE